MQMKDVIRQKRRERGLTQEQVAERLGVSAPAVNKWESGASYPDITLLSALARLLETDLNELFCFRENLTKEEITGYANEIGEIARKDGVEKALELVRERIRECGRLEDIWSGASCMEKKPVKTGRRKRIDGRAITADQRR